MIYGDWSSERCLAPTGDGKLFAARPFHCWVLQTRAELRAVSTSGGSTDFPQLCSSPSDHRFRLVPLATILFGSAVDMKPISRRKPFQIVAQLW